jgi:hypothetical protein
VPIPLPVAYGCLWFGLFCFSLFFHQPLWLPLDQQLQLKQLKQNWVIHRAKKYLLSGPLEKNPADSYYETSLLIIFLKNLFLSRAWWYTSVIQATWEAEMGGLWFKASPGKSKLARPYLKKQVGVVVCACNSNYREVEVGGTTGRWR